MDEQKYKELPLFQHMQEKEIHEILLTAGCFVKNFKKGNYIYQENEVIHSLGVILTGHVYMVKEDVWGEETILVRMGKGDLFGENFACSPNPASTVTFYAPQAAEVLFIPYERLLRHAGNRNVLLFITNLISMMTYKSQNLMRKINVVSRKSLREKIQCFLSLEAEKTGKLDFTIPFSREEMAEYVCANRSALSRELKAMEKDGLIELKGRKCRILKKQG
ncbi:Crp/Fnr family transcriptional regulator [uncultured Dialister sp.]|jgi:CRP-like cAMP-binding protein|uniref:Crp/Fnr family transcriptional regulator n=1 Tax=uncultured Dialister sp. TaxID=278064 RepID=UPI0026225A86|nr:Crp/Fnr family transcriptional regulator [uncultured Dialister sp.]